MATKAADLATYPEVTLADVQAAHQVIAPYIVRTPCWRRDLAEV
jgi:hypothetical protein